MSSMSFSERSRLQQELGASDEQIRHLQQQLVRQRADCEASANEWRRFLRYQSDLGEWLIDAATNEEGKVVTPRIDAALGGETCVPCSFTMAFKGKQYQLDLVSTSYEVRES